MHQPEDQSRQLAWCLRSATDHNMYPDRLYTMSDLPPDLLRRILTNLPELCRLSTRGVLTCVCKSWAGVVQAHKELFLSPDCLDSLGLLTQGQSLRLNNTLSNIELLRTKCLLSHQVGQAIKVAQACPKLRVMEVDTKRKYDDFMILDDEARSKFGFLWIELLRPTSWALKLQKFSLFTSDMTLLTMVIPSPLTGKFLDCITAGHIDILHAAFPSFWPSADGTAFKCMPALQLLEVGANPLFEVGYTETVRGALNPKNLHTFRTACEVHCTGWSGPLHLQKTLLSSVKPFSTIKSWVAESASCAALICTVAPDLQVLKVNDLYISEGTIARVNLIDSLQSVDLACSKPLRQMRVEGCPGKGLRHLKLMSFNIVLTQQVAQWLADVQRRSRHWRVFVNLGSGRNDIDIVDVEELK